MRRLRPALAVILAGLLSACDKFFSVQGVVNSCDTDQPLAGAKILAHLDQGVGEPDHHLVTGPDGKFDVFLNEPPSAWVTVQIGAPGYVTWVTQFRGIAPHQNIVVCLESSRNKSEPSPQLPSAAVPNGGKSLK